MRTQLHFSHFNFQTSMHHSPPSKRSDFPATSGFQLQLPPASNIPGSPSKSPEPGTPNPKTRRLSGGAARARAVVGALIVAAGILAAAFLLAGHRDSQPVLARGTNDVGVPAGTNAASAAPATNATEDVITNSPVAAIATNPVPAAVIAANPVAATNDASPAIAAASTNASPVTTEVTNPPAVAITTNSVPPPPATNRLYASNTATNRPYPAINTNAVRSAPGTNVAYAANATNAPSAKPVSVTNETIRTYNYNTNTTNYVYVIDTNRVNDSWTTNRFETTNRFSLSARIGFGMSVRFGGFVSLPVPKLNRATSRGDAYNYDDGYVLSDISGGFGGQTWYWGYDDSARQVSGNNILLSRNTATGPTAGTDIDGDPGYGAELVYTRMLGAKGRFQYGFEAALNYLNISMKDSSSQPINLIRTTDTYAFTPGTTPPLATPGAPYQGSYEGPGFVISDTPSSSRTTVLAGGGSAVGHRDFDADIWGARIGPCLEYAFTERFRVSLSGGFAAALVDADVSWSESVLISGTQGVNVSGSGSDSDFLFGAYVALNAGYQFNDSWSVVGSAQYQYLSNYNHSFGGRSVEADLKGIFITLGIAYKF